MESVYKKALAIEFGKLDIRFEKEKAIEVFYEKENLGLGFRCDFFVENRVIIECKSVKALMSVDSAQTINYISLINAETGLLINFNVEHLKNGIKRLFPRKLFK